MRVLAILVALLISTLMPEDAFAQQRAIPRLAPGAQAEEVPELGTVGSWSDEVATRSCTFYPIGWQRLVAGGDKSFKDCSARCQTAETFGEGCTKQVCNAWCHHTWAESDIRASDKTKTLPDYAGNSGYFWNVNTGEPATAPVPAPAPMPAPASTAAPAPMPMHAVRPAGPTPVDLRFTNQSAYVVNVRLESTDMQGHLPSVDNAELAPTASKSFHWDDKQSFIAVHITWLDGLEWRTLTQTSMCRMEGSPNCLSPATLANYCITGTPFDGGAKGGGC